MVTANERQIGGDHYRSNMQHWDYVLANRIPYLEAQIIKYLTRWRSKDGFKDLQKAQHFLQKLFESEGLQWARDEDMATQCAEAEPTAYGYVDQDRESLLGFGRKTSAINSPKGKR